MMERLREARLRALERLLWCELYNIASIACEHGYIPIDIACPGAPAGRARAAPDAEQDGFIGHAAHVTAGWFDAPEDPATLALLARGLRVAGDFPDAPPSDEDVFGPGGAPPGRHATTLGAGAWYVGSLVLTAAVFCDAPPCSTVWGVINYWGLVIFPLGVRAARPVARAWAPALRTAEGRGALVACYSLTPKRQRIVSRALAAAVADRDLAAARTVFPDGSAETLVRAMQRRGWAGAAAAPVSEFNIWRGSGLEFGYTARDLEVGVCARDPDFKGWQHEDTQCGWAIDTHANPSKFFLGGGRERLAVEAGPLLCLTQTRLSLADVHHMQRHIAHACNFSAFAYIHVLCAGAGTPLAREMWDTLAGAPPTRGAWHWHSFEEIVEHLKGTYAASYGAAATVPWLSAWAAAQLSASHTMWANAVAENLTVSLWEGTFECGAPLRGSPNLITPRLWWLLLSRQLGISCTLWERVTAACFDRVDDVVTYLRRDPVVTTMLADTSMSMAARVAAAVATRPIRLVNNSGAPVHSLALPNAVAGRLLCECRSTVRRIPATMHLLLPKTLSAYALRRLYKQGVMRHQWRVGVTGLHVPDLYTRGARVFPVLDTPAMGDDAMLRQRHRPLFENLAVLMAGEPALDCVCWQGPAERNARRAVAATLRASLARAHAGTAASRVGEKRSAAAAGGAAPAPPKRARGADGGVTAARVPSGRDVIDAMFAGLPAALIGACLSYLSWADLVVPAWCVGIPHEAFVVPRPLARPAPCVHMLREWSIAPWESTQALGSEGVLFLQRDRPIGAAFAALSDPDAAQLHITSRAEMVLPIKGTNPPAALLWLVVGHEEVSERVWAQRFANCDAVLPSCAACMEDVDTVHREVEAALLHPATEGGGDELDALE